MILEKAAVSPRKEVVSFYICSISLKKKFFFLLFNSSGFFVSIIPAKEMGRQIFFYSSS